MTFSSLAFLFVFFPVVFILYWLCANRHLRNIILVLASLIFYAYGEPVAVFIMLISICLNYVFGLMCSYDIAVTDDSGISKNAENKTKGSIPKSAENKTEGGIPTISEIQTESSSKKSVEPKSRNNAKKSNKSQKKSFNINKLGLILAVILNIGLLVVFKYSDFILENIGLQKYSLSLKLPIGISFFTFQGLSYVVDVYRDKENVQKNFLSVMLYISFFPQLIAGPIVKYHDIREQLSKREFNIDNISAGLQRFIYGLGKKVLIAGPMGLMVDTIYNQDVTTVGTFTAWIVAISYMFQIYFDFSGYSDMAIGLGKVFGFDFNENFDKPYSAKSIKIFWRKWHISLSTWFKEYVYIPLGGNRKGVVRTYLNKFTVFLLTGLWHGANWTFVVWGVLHGTGMIIEDIIQKIRKARKRKTSEEIGFLAWLFGRIYTLLFVMLAFVIFRADNLHIAGIMLSKLVGGGGSNVVAFSLLTPIYLIALVLAVICSSTVTDNFVRTLRPWVKQTFSLLVYVASIFMLLNGGYNPFIYFRF